MKHVWPPAPHRDVGAVEKNAVFSSECSEVAVRTVWPGDPDVDPPVCSSSGLAQLETGLMLCQWLPACEVLSGWMTPKPGACWPRGQGLMVPDAGNVPSEPGPGGRHLYSGWLSFQICICQVLIMVVCNLGLLGGGKQRLKKKILHDPCARGYGRFYSGRLLRVGLAEEGAWAPLRIQGKGGVHRQGAG